MGWPSVGWLGARLGSYIEWFGTQERKLNSGLRLTSYLSTS